MAWKPSRPSSPGKTEGGWLQRVTQVAGLFAGLAAVVYATGAVVLSLRLEFEQLPWSNVISQLPREFMLSIGVGQVLLPALAVGALYGLYRLIRKDRKRPPKPYRLREGWKALGVVLMRYTLTWLLMLTPPLVVFWLARSEMSVFDVDRWLLVGIAAVVVVAAMGLQEGRAIVIKRNQVAASWNSTRTAAIMAAIYAAGALPAMVLAASALPLSAAKVCTTEGDPEQGVLVGESSDRVYLGEKVKKGWRSRHPRIAVFPLTRVEEMFIGPKAWKSYCKDEEAPATLPRGDAHNPQR